MMNDVNPDRWLLAEADRYMESQYDDEDHCIESTRDKDDETHCIIGSTGKVYTITRVDGEYTCSCPGFVYRGTCKHLNEFLGDLCQ